jgi:hypothetical protein
VESDAAAAGADAFVHKTDRLDPLLDAILTLWQPPSQ